MVIWSIIVWQTFKKKEEIREGANSFSHHFVRNRTCWYELIWILYSSPDLFLHWGTWWWFVLSLHNKGRICMNSVCMNYFQFACCPAGWFSSIFNDHFKALYARPYEQRFDPGISPSVYRWNTSCMYHFYARIFRLTK